MTQEELDALVNEAEDPDFAKNTEGSESKDSDSPDFDPTNFRINATKEWPPPPPDKDHKVVHQLDDVTKDTELKGLEVFDQLDIISANADNTIKLTKQIQDYLKRQEEIFQKLSDRFSHVQTFQKALEETKQIQANTKTIIDNANSCSDATLQAMDVMQFQDINRQRIERVINVMRALSQYMNSLFESKIDDSKRVSSAVYITGDNSKDVASADDIENLIASFGKK